MNWFGPRPVRAAFVYTKTGNTLKGVLVDVQRHFLVLRAARLGSVEQATNAETWTPMPGDVVIPMDNVDFWQEALDPGVLE